MPGPIVDAAVQVRGIGDAAKGRQPPQGEVHLRHRSARAVVADLREEARVELDRIDESRNVRRGSAFETTAPAGISVAVRRARRRRRVLRDEDRARPRASVRISAPAVRAASAIAAASAPGRPDRDAAAAGTRIGGGVQQQHRAAARRPRTLRRAEDAARGDRRLQQVGLEPLGDEVGDRHRPPAQQPEAVLLAERAEAPCRSSAAPTSRPPPASRCRAASSRAGPTRNAAEPLQRRAELRIRGRVLRRERRGSPPPSAPMSVENASARPSGRERHEPRIGLNELHRRVEAHVAHDRRPQRPDRVGERRLEPRARTPRSPRSRRRSARASRTSGLSPAFAR